MLGVYQKAPEGLSDTMRNKTLWSDDKETKLFGIRKLITAYQRIKPVPTVRHTACHNQTKGNVRKVKISLEEEKSFIKVTGLVQPDNN